MYVHMYNVMCMLLFNFQCIPVRLYYEFLRFSQRQF
jgi:hypothetical protein